MTKDEALKLALKALVTAGINENCVYGETEIIRKTLAQPERTWVGLTDEEIDHFCHLAYTGDEELVLTIQARLKEKNT